MQDRADKTKVARTKVPQLVLVATLAGMSSVARADVVTDWNAKAAEITAAPGLPVPAAYFAYRAMAMVQVAVFDGVTAVTRRHPPLLVKLDPVPDASIEAVVAAATRTSLLKLIPSQRTAIDAAYEAALANIPDSRNKERGFALGERAATTVLAQRADDGAVAPDSYRPHTAPGVYVPTTLPVAPHWGKRKPWVMVSGDQFRPGPPPQLTSELWARDYNEVRLLGGRDSAERSAENTSMARFWEAAVPAIYFNVIRSATTLPERDVTDNARLLALTAMAMDDALIAIIDAKYAYGFWRPITAIRNGDIDGNGKTERQEGWLPLIDTPMHPEYPCAHCILSAAVGTILKSEMGGTAVKLAGTSPTAPGATRSWAKIEDFMTEVRLARILAGVHYRNSTEVGSNMGEKIGALAVATHRSVAKN